MRSFTALVNPVAGGGHADDRWQPVADALTAAGAAVRVQHTESREHAVRLAAEAALRGDVVVAVGGDGMARDAAEGVVTADGVLGIVAAGRGNDFAHKVGLPSDPAEVADLLLNGEPRPIDVLETGGTIVLGNVYAGVDSLSNAMINRSRWIPAPLLYRLAPAMALLSWKAPEYTVVADGQTIVAKAHIVVVANSGAYGHGLRIVPGAEVDDGLLDVLIVDAGPKRMIVSFMSQAKTGAHVNRPEVRVIRAREVTVSADKEIPVGVDGEDHGVLPFSARIRPSALRLIAP